MLKYTPDHEWLMIENDTATIGITAFAQERLGDLVFVELPKPGSTLRAGGAAAVVAEAIARVRGIVTRVAARRAASELLCRGRCLLRRRQRVV